MNRRLFAVLCAVILLMCQFALIPPQEVSAGTPGSDLVVRVGYLVNPKEYRIKETLSKAQINSLVQETNRYTNVSSDGTVKSFIAQGPAVTSILRAAGISVRSVYYMDLRTTNGSGTDDRFEENPKDPAYTSQSYLEGGRYYYPKLENNWQKKGKNGIPKKGALAGGQPVSTILAVRSSDEDAQKPENGAEGLTPEMMSTGDSYRFCAGQTPLIEGVATKVSKDATAGKNAKWVYGIDVILYGSPVEDLRLLLDANRIIVGYKVQARAEVTADPLFIKSVEDVEFIWTSSNHEIATIDDNGLIYFKKKGHVKIKVTEKSSRMSIAYTLNVSEKKGEGDKENGDENEGDQEESDKDTVAAVSKKTGGKGKDIGSKKTIRKPGKAKDKKNIKAKKESEKKAKKVKKDANAKRVSLGDEMGADELGPDEKYKNAVPLIKRKANKSVLFVAGFTVALFFVGGALTRIDSYLKER